MLNSHKKYFEDGSALVSDESYEKREELRRRKEQIIAILNKTYDHEGGSEHSNSQNTR
jgi:hypothetical protein